ncbi:MAG: ATP-dependent Clp protease ATP-binding subunit, partial [Anaerolineales bacterium]|nr:ATP-dependent Clp protease ATP-binding subunit [Anaerolineales bacterium]
MTHSEPAADFRAFLSTFAENLTARPPAEVYGREAETRQVLLALASPLKGRVVVTGPARVGKTTVVQAAAQAIARGACPPELRGKEVWRFSPSGLPGLGQAGHWQAALEQLLAGWAAHPALILFIEDLPRAARLPGGSSDDDEARNVDVATLLAAGLTHQSGLCLAESDGEVWRRFTEAYPDYGRLFLSVSLTEPGLAAAQPIVQQAADDLGRLNGVSVGADAVELALDLSQRYLLDRAQPGKALDLIKDALAVARRAAGDPGARLTSADIIARFGEQTGLPRILLDDAVPFDEVEVRRLFKGRVLAQEQAVEAIVQVLSLLRARVNNPLRPMGVLLFLGPTGVGKTELARTLAEYLYSDRDRLVRFNMADYTSPHAANALFGAAYANDVAQRRGLITTRLAGRPFAVIVLDEFEKAHPYIYFRFLQLFDEGLLLNGNDETINLRNAILILTSNFGAQLVEHGRLGF